MMMMTNNDADGVNEERLTGVKLSLASLLFILVLLACTTPSLIVHRFYQKRKRSFPHCSTSTDHDASNRLEYNSRLWKFFTSSNHEHNYILSRANCLAAGAFLSIGFLDIYPDATELMNEAKLMLNLKTDFSLTSFLVLIGFFLILGSEQLVEDALQMNLHGRENVSNQTSSTTLNTDLVNQKSTTSHFNAILDMNRSNQVTQISSIDLAISKKHNNEGVFEFVPIIDPNEHDHGGLSVFGLLCALSFHSVFEGISLGFCRTKQSLFTMFGALCLHKLIIATGIGINLTNEFNEELENQNLFTLKGIRKPKILTSLLAIVLFAASSPLGVLIGWSLHFKSDSVVLVCSSAILQSLACGTIIYIIFFELLAKEFHHSGKDKAGKFLFLILGFALVCGMIILSPEE